MMFQNDPSISDYTKGYTTAEVDLSVYGVEFCEAQLLLLKKTVHPVDHQFVIGYATAINVRKERLAR